MVQDLPPGERQDAWRTKLEVLKAQSKANNTTATEIDASKQFVEQLHFAKKAKTHLDKILDKHPGDSERELLKAMKNNGVDQKTFHNGMIVGNKCLTLGKRAKSVIKEVDKAMRRKIKIGRIYLTSKQPGSHRRRFSGFGTI